MIVIASGNGSVGIEAAMRVLKAGGSALDAVEAGIKPVESNPQDHTVGYSGLPNLVVSTRSQDRLLLRMTDLNV